MAVYSTPPGYGNLIAYPEKHRKTPKHPNWKGILVCHRDYRAGQVIRLVGWNIKAPWGTESINLQVNPAAGDFTQDKRDRLGWEGQKYRKAVKEKKERKAVEKEIRRKDAGDLPE
jgi:hypothetical protein